MNRTGNNTTGWARRLTALLVTACLVMAMALPVYAKVDPLPDAPDEVELLEDEPGTASGEDTAPLEQNAATPEPEQSAGPEQPAPTETPEPTAEPTPTPEPAATATATPVPTVTPTATPEPTEQPQMDAEEAEDEDGALEVSERAATDGFTVYFAVNSSNTIEGKTIDDTDVIKFNGQMDSGNTWCTHPMEKTTIKTSDGRTIYALRNCTDATGNNFTTIQFQLWSGNNGWKGKIELKVSATINSYNLKMYDAEAGTWTDASTLEGYKYFAGKTIKFENRSTVDLKNVKADFYIPDEYGSLKPVNNDSTARDVTQGKTINFTIPSEDCSYIQFTWEGGSSKYYNFYGESASGDDDNKEYFRYSEANNCFIYTSADNVRWGVESSVRIYFDASLSSYSYDRDIETSKNSMPTKDGRMYCFFKKSDNTYSEVFKMEEEQTTSGRELWYVDVPEGCKKVRFSAWKLEGDKINENIAEKNDLTAMLDIPENLNEPCFFADSGDPDMYASGNINRDGYWGEKNDVRDAEAGKNNTVVDITSDYSRGNSKGIKYITSTLYDYYTDYELNGNNRDNYATDPDLVTYRIHVPFRQFDQAVSDYYKNYENADKILYPIYTGHFQYVDNHCFSKVAEGLSLFGWSNRDKDESKYKSFMAANNSEIDEGSGSEKYEFAFLGIVGNKLDSNGNLLMRESNGTDGTGLVEPHFNEAFLNGENSKNTKLGQVYKNVEFPFTQKQIFSNEPGVNYWWYDAAKTSLYLRKDNTTGAYYLGNGNGDGSTVNTLSDNSKNKDSQNKDTPNGHGFFPFNETVSSVDVRRYNYGYGAKLEIPFTLTEDGTVLDNNNVEQSIKFYFSGDDDVWVFIDGQLVLDIGGAHGKAAGIIDFDQRGTNKNKVTAYVSKVKYNKVTKAEYSAGEKKTIVYTGNDLKEEKYNPTKYYYSNTVDIPNLSTGKHTLTMYYMERGMWESNMAVAFNFPDNNELQVQKIVDTTDVNDWFKSCFDTPDLFAFNIQNQATHYRQPEHDATIDSDVNLIELNTSDYASYEPATKNNKGNIFELTTAPTGEEALHWYGQYQDTNPPSECRSERYGILTLNHAIDISQKRYLTFDIYAKSESGQGVLSLGNLYLELLDKNGKQKGCLDKTCLNGTTYGTVTLANDEWITVKLDLHKLNAVEGFDLEQVTKIRVGDNYPRHIYFKDFVFSAQAKATTKTGFTTKQEDIPVYGSIDAKGLKNAAGAQFTTTKNNDTQVVDKNGQFMLQNGETVTFSDQFRRGSYISLKETLNPNLYDTTWTVFENDEVVQSYGSGNTVKGDTKNLNGQAATESQPGPDDGRTEVYDSRPDIKNDGYTGDKKPDANTIVFRSYKDPDENTSSLTKLKVQFVNKVKTGKLVIKKAAASGEDNLIKGEYTFNVTFTNVGDESLEQKPIKKQVTINMKTEDHCEISGIPIGTRFRIEEVKTSDGSHLQGVSVTGGGVDTQVVGNTYVQGSISGSGTNVTATFTNTKHELINIDFTKTWKNANGDLLEDGLPDKIYIQLQRRKTENDIWQPVKYLDAISPEYVMVTPTSKGWDYPFANLDKFDVTDHTNYQYRIVEGTVDDKGNFTAKDGTITIGDKTYGVTANATPKSETNSETGATTTPATATDGTITGGSGKIELTNTLQNPKFGLNIIKKDAETNNEGKDVLLSGVEFKLEKLKAEATTEGKTQWVVDKNYKFDSTKTDSITGTTGTDGKIIDNPFTNLEPGTYRLTETRAHPGYNLLAQPIKIQFTQDGKCYIDGQAIEDEDKFKPGTNNTYTLTLTVLNRKTPELPHTGADAPSLWLLIGMPLAVAGLLIFTFRYNRKGGRRH